MEINGIKYQQKEEPKRNPMPKTLMALMLMAQMTDGIYGNSKPKTRPKIDIVKEFELIQQKKSNLSRSQREWVIIQFEHYYEVVS